MKNSELVAVVLALGVALGLSVGVVYGMTRQASSLPGGYFGGMMSAPGYGGWTNAPTSAYRGGMMGGFGGMGGMMGGFGGVTGYRGMMGGWPGYASTYPNHGRGGAAGGTFVPIVNYGFYPASLAVPRGSTVTWVNMDFVQHTVTSGSEQAQTSLFDSHELGHMQSFSYTFNVPGTYTYYCDLHPDMVGTITVTD